MAESKLSTRSSALIWFGAAVSVAEILTGTWFVPLGWEQGILAVVLGHLIGGALFFCAGLIGAKTGRSAMQSTQISFGEKGSVLFSAANVLQLLGWTAIMIYTSAAISATLTSGWWHGSTATWWSLITGALIVLWLFYGSRHMGTIKTLTMIAMFAITVWLSIRVFSAPKAAAATSASLSFGTAVELAVVMPLSWLPLVSDYTRNAKQPVKATAAATVAYTITSCWMYALGLAAALFSGQTDVAQILLAAGLGVAGVLVVVFSTVTTTFLDAYSAGVSANNINSKWKETPLALAVTVIGTILAMTLPVTKFENFLLLIGSVFTPMVAVQIADFFVMKRTEVTGRFDWTGLILWALGFALYRVLLAMQWETMLGLTFPVMVAVTVLTVLVRKVLRTK